MHEMFRDKSRDEMAESLNSSSVKAEIADRGGSEEKIRSGSIFLKPFGQQSLGLIDILDGGLSSWINVVRMKRRDKNSGQRYRAVLGITEVYQTKAIPWNHKQLKIKTVRRKASPILGKVIDVYWKAKGSL
jgi:hypothetical protein